MFRRRLVPVTLVGWMRTPQPATASSRVDHDSMLSTSSSILRQDYPASSASSASSAALTESKRGIKTLAVREYKPMGQPIELRFYQRYTNNPLKQSGIQFLTHYNHYQRWRAHTKDYIDYMNWGKEQGQARLPHRHQRVAFDFHDSLPPTKTTYKSELFQTQDPSKDHSEGFDASFDPNKKTFSFPYHWNRLFSKRRPGEGDINTAPFGTRSLISKMQTYSDVGTEAAFYSENRAANHGIVPGINAPFLGEQDSKMMQSMSVPLCSKTNKVTTNEGRFSKSLYLNNAKNNQLVNAKFAKTLSTEIDKATNAVHSKLVVLTSAQSGLTESFCQGVDFTDIGLQMSKAKECRDKAEALTLSLGRSGITPAESAAIDRQLSQLLSDAHRYESRADNTLRLHSELMWRVFTAARPLMTIINGKCRGTGNGVALLSKFAVTRDSSEFTFDGANRALTPFGGLTHYLARPETSLKYPGLAEFTMLTGASLFAGDVLRLGWTDLFSNTADLDFHIKDWFNNTEHMHNDAIAWQLGHLLDSTCKMREAHSGAVERCAITPTRARWIEDAFADQPSVESIVATLTEMEQLSTSDADPHNTRDGATLTPFTLTTVADGIMKLREQNMHYSLAPWDLTAPAEAVGEEHSGSMFTQYVLERRANVDVVLHSDRNKLRKWREQRYSEFKAHEALRKAPCARHVFVRLEGCEGRLVDFEFIFDKQSADDNVLQTMNAATVAKKTKFKYDLTSEEQTQTAMVDAFSQSVRTAFGLNADRLLSLGWYMPTFDTCPIHSDEELLEILAADPGVEDLSNPTRYPPLYFIVKRHDMHLSEWAYAVKHQLLLQSPYALKASLALLHEVRGSGASNDVASLSESISKEFKYIRRMISRQEFAEVGQHTEHDLEYWTDVRDRRSKNLHEMENPLRPLRTFDDVFEHEVEISGHKFQVRPRWSPRTLEEVDDADIAKLVAPLDFERDATTELDVPTFASKQQYIVGMTDDAGVEVVAGLGEVDKATGVPKVAPLVSNAKVPDNVDFYEMARHPWLDTKSSWRQEGFTAGSQEYFVQQYQAAQKALYDAKDTGQYNYWPAKSDVEGNDWTEEEQTLLQDRFYSAFQEGEQSVQSWASTLRQQAKDGTFTKRLELATQDEKILDDNYYRWFIQPGVHPNPSGLTRRGLAATASSEEDMEVQRAFSSFGVHVDVEAATATTQFAGEDSSGVVDDELYEVGSSSGSAAAEAGEE